MSDVQASQVSDGGWVVAENHVWFPGSYASEEAARAAVALGATLTTYEARLAFQQMQERVNHFDRENRLITCEDLGALMALLATHESPAASRS